ncbi:MAG: hypothetical protein A3J83_07330 [Elusimicrobia bacterium RIFOXYA2_FULL_40_6]|nr:MAG: hypothetical protein A3J83_07330 [Elusimicrobia bacterium RIFOXYA2_FULL_40_6]
MKKTGLSTNLLLGFILLLCSQCLYAGWPINRTPAIEGKIVDASTGEPIENVVFEAVWEKAGGSISLDGLPISPCAVEQIVSSKDGSFKIPPKTTLHIFSKFFILNIRMYHPLYVTEEMVCSKINKNSLKRSPTLVAMGAKEGKYAVIITSPTTPGNKMITQLVVEQDSRILLSIPLVSLEEKFINQVKDKSKENLDKLIGREFLPCVTMHNNAGYFLTLKNRKKDFNLEEIVNKWRKIGEKLASDEKGLNVIDNFISITKTNIEKHLKEGK